MTPHATGTPAEWRAALRTLHERERELNRLREEIRRERWALPWVRVETAYTLETAAGPQTLAELFDGRSELLVYHLMFGPSWTAACPGCSLLADHFDGMLAHLGARDVTLIGVSHAPIEKVQAYKRRMGWQFLYASSFRSDFNYDFGASFTPEQQREIAAQVHLESSQDAALAEAAASCGTDLAGYLTTEGPGLDAFALADGVVYHTYAADPREVSVVSVLEVLAQWLERAPKGGTEGVPVARHDEYPVAGGGAHG